MFTLMLGLIVGAVAGVMGTCAMIQIVLKDS